MKFDNAQYEASFGTAKQLMQSDMPEIAFSGRSNVGKSSLINKLLNRKSLARVSSTPGKTTTINFFKLKECRFADLPGYGYAKVSPKEKERWSDLMETYFSSNRNIALVIQLIDIRHTPSEQDFQMLDFLKQMNLPFIIALTKSDKLKKTQLLKRLEELEKELAFLEMDLIKIPFSALKGDGVKDLQSEIEKAIFGEV